MLTLAGSNTGLSQPRGVVVDVTGKVYVANSAADSVTEYAPEVTGNVAPAVTLTGARTKLSSPQGLALDSSGDLWVSNAKGSVLEFAPGASGNAKPLTVISGSATGLHDPQGLNFDPAGVLHVSNSNGRVTTYVSGAHGNAAAQQRIGAGILTQPEGLNFDGAGDMLVADAAKDQIDEFPPTATASSSPTVTIAGMGTGLNAPVGLDLDTANDLFVANSAGNSVTEYPPGASGSRSPMATIFGPATGLNDPAFLSELPPPPVPRVHVALPRRIAIKTLVHDRRLVIALRASGRLAFRSGSLRVTVTARLSGGRELAVVRTTFLTGGHQRLALVLTPRDRKALRHTRAKLITITVALRDGAGTQRKHLSVRLRR